MKLLIRIFIGTASLSATIASLVLMFRVKSWRGPMAGMGDNAVEYSAPLWEQLLNVFLIGAIGILTISPYVCMAAGAFNLIAGKRLCIAYVYSLVMLSILTLIMLVSFYLRLEFIALGNIIIGGLWAYHFRPNGAKPDEREADPEGKGLL